MSVQYLDIDESHDVGQRIDNYLMKTLKGVPRQHIYKILRRGEVRINKGRIKATYRLKLGDRIRIPPISTKEALPIQFSERAAEELRSAVLYEDEDYLILNKPAGVAVHGGSSISAGVVEILREVTANPRLELVHRLDRNTSGCLALAKKPAALKLAQLKFRERQVKKIYEAYVEGLWPNKLRVVQLKLKRYETSWGERRVRVDSLGQTARTDFQVLAHAGSAATHLQATLHTGRTHQIRVHTSARGYAILGDDKYQSAHINDGTDRDTGTAQANNHSKLNENIPRMCLHARKLAIPLGESVLKVTAPLPREMQAIWANLAAQAGKT